MRWLAVLVAGFVSAGALVGCGAPTSATVEPLADVPYNLLSPATGATSAPTTDPETRPLVFLVRDDVLVPVKAPEVTGDSVSATVTATLARLAEGPGEEARDQGLSSALGADVGITLAGMEGTRAVIDVQPGAQVPTAGRLPLAVGQIVLTVLSVPGAESVSLSADGEPIQAPLPGGELTDRPLVASDYLPLTAARTPTSTSTTAPTG
jgi:hypothetical protein